MRGDKRFLGVYLAKQSEGQNVKIAIRRILFSLLAMLVLTGLLSGCNSPGSKEPKPASLGVIDMEKAILAHPKNQELEKLRQQYLAMEEQLALLAARMRQADTPAVAAVNPEEQEFNSKMAAREQELQNRFNARLETELAKANEALQSYADELEKEMQPELFSIQLKLNALQNSSAEALQLTARADAIKKEFQNKMAARQAQLNAQIDQVMAPEKQAVEKELSEYARQLQQELQARSAAQQAAAARINIAADGPAAELQKALGLKRTEIESLQAWVINDVRSQAAKVAAEKQLDVLLAGQRVNVTAVDLTDAVIVELKK